MMKRLIALGLVTALSLVFTLRAESQDVRLYIQVVCATEDDKPASSRWTKIGPKLQKKLGAVFRWQAYWEVNRLEVSMVPGKTVKKSVTKTRALEMSIVREKTVEVRFIRDGHIRRTMYYSLDSDMMIGGWDSGPKEAWFIVVRGSKPSNERRLGP